MNNINLFALLLVGLQSLFLAAQESSDFAQATTDTSDFASGFDELTMTDNKVHDESTKQSCQEIINEAIQNFPNLVEGFQILQEQNLVNQSFYDYLTKNLNNDENEDQEVNSGEVITDAIDLVVDTIKVPFLTNFKKIIQKYNNLDPIQDPIFTYVMKYKDGFMQLPLKQLINDNDHDLHIAAKNNNKDAAQLLINIGAHVNIKNNDGWTPLHMAARQNSVEVARILINAGAHVNIKNNSDWTALHMAAQWNRTDIARILIDAGAPVNLQAKNGDTPLHRAIRHNNVEVTNMLIHAGADSNIKNKSGWTALHQINFHKKPTFQAEETIDTVEISVCTIS